MSIKSYIQGKHITHNYEVRENRDQNTGKFTRKPELIMNDEIVWKTLLNENGEEFVVNGEVGKTSRNSYSSLFMFDMGHRINLSETEEVYIDEQIYRADLHAYMVHTNKVLSEEDASNTEDIKYGYDVVVSEYNMQMIASDKKLEAYCGVHKLNPATTDYDELKKVVYGDSVDLSGCVVSGYVDKSCYMI